MAAVVDEQARGKSRLLYRKAVASALSGAVDMDRLECRSSITGDHLEIGFGAAAFGGAGKRKNS